MIFSIWCVVGSWLESLQLDQYQATLVAHSITSLSQVVNLTLEVVEVTY